MTPLAQIADAVEMARAAARRGDIDEHQRWVDAAHSAVDRLLNGEAEPGAIKRKRDPRHAAIEDFFAASKARHVLASEGTVTIDLTESECERCGSPYELTTTETGRVVCNGDCPNPAWQHGTPH